MQIRKLNVIIVLIVIETMVETFKCPPLPLFHNKTTAFTIDTFNSLIDVVSLLVSFVCLFYLLMKKMNILEVLYLCFHVSHILYINPFSLTNNADMSL